jgi:macrolide transport system ATP-binding/permease protein
MHILGCLDRPTTGHYRVFGRDTAGLDADALAQLRRESFGFVFQRYNLIGALDAVGNVAIPAVYAGVRRGDREAHARDLLTGLGLSDRLDHRPSEMSGGQQQRVAIARALVNDPPIILADEPTGALDSGSGRDVLALLQAQHRAGRTVVLITHDAAVAAHAGRILRIADGRLVGEDRGDARSDDATHPRWGALAPRCDTSGASTAVRMFEALRMAGEALRANVFRTSLTLLGIVIGVAAVIAMMAVGDGSERQVLNSIDAMGSNLLMVRPGSPGVRFAGDLGTLTPQDAAAIAALPGVEALLPERMAHVTVRSGDVDAQTTLQGTGSALPQVRDWPPSSGAFFAESDVATRAPVALLGRTVAAELFPGGDDPVGRYVSVGNVLFQVIGVMSAKGASPVGTDQDDAIFTPYTTALTRVSGKPYLSDIIVKAAPGRDVQAMQASIAALLADRHHQIDFQIRNMAEVMATARQTQGTLTMLLGAVASVSLLVGGIGVMNIMLVSVTERTREIGVRLAVGARVRDILLQFNVEAALVCAVGGVVGVLLGFGSAGLIAALGGPVALSAGPPAAAFACAVGTGLLFGYLPARKAAHLDPVVALASE